jgi:AraC-like DNA-binding protein
MKIFYHTHQLPKDFTHAHDGFEIMYCVCGSYDFHYVNVEGETVHVANITPRTMIFIPKGLPHGDDNVQYPYRRYFLDLPVEETIDLLSSPTLLSPFQTHIVNEHGRKERVPRCLDTSQTAPLIEAMFEHMLTIQLELAGSSLQPHAGGSGAHTDLYLRSIVGMLFCELNRQHPDFFAAPQYSYSGMVAQVRAYLDAHYDEPITIGELAKQQYVHPSYLSHCFTEQLGVSPRQYLTNLRLENARKLLEFSDDSVQAVALKVGFGDVNNFIQSFRERYGLTPRRYRVQTAAQIIG